MLFDIGFSPFVEMEYAYCVPYRQLNLISSITFCLSISYDDMTQDIGIVTERATIGTDHHLT